MINQFPICSPQPIENCHVSSEHIWDVDRRVGV